MRTTVRMGEKLLEDARNKARDENRSLNDLIVEALEGKVYTSFKEPTAEYTFTPQIHKGGSPLHGIDLNDNSSLLEAMEDFQDGNE